MAEEETLESPAGGRVVVSDPAAVTTLIYGSGYRRVDPGDETGETTAEPVEPTAESARPAAPAEPARTADTGRAAKPATEK